MQRDRRKIERVDFNPDAYVVHVAPRCNPSSTLGLNLAVGGEAT